MKNPIAGKGKFIGYLLIAITSGLLSIDHGWGEPPQNKDPRYAVTYDLGGGRFGDKLLGYLHAKWISYRYGLPLLYRPFNNSNQFMMDIEEKKYCPRRLKKYQNTLVPSPGMKVNFKGEAVSTLYVIPYFPEYEWEFAVKNRWYSFKVHWEDPAFLALIRKMLTPISLRPKLMLPDNYVHVAVHMRKGGNYDPADTWLFFPLKLPPDNYYINQIRRIASLYPGKPLYVYVFTDDPNPLKLVAKLKNHLKGLNILFDCKTEANQQDDNVLQDFIEMTQFTCLIRPDSNYSFVISKLKDFETEISPVHFTWTAANQGYVDESLITLSRRFHGNVVKDFIHVFDK